MKAHVIPTSRLLSCNGSVQLETRDGVLHACTNRIGGQELLDGTSRLELLPVAVNLQLGSKQTHRGEHRRTSSVTIHDILLPALEAKGLSGEMNVHK